MYSFMGADTPTQKVLGMLVALDTISPSHKIFSTSESWKVEENFRNTSISVIGRYSVTEARPIFFVSIEMKGCELQHVNNEHSTAIVSVTHSGTTKYTIIPSKLASPFGTHSRAICTSLFFCCGTSPLKPMGVRARGVPGEGACGSSKVFSSGTL